MKRSLIILATALLTAATAHAEGSTDSAAPAGPTFSGRVRYRLEAIDTGPLASQPTSYTNRILAQLAATFHPVTDWEGTVGIATGSPNPISDNATLTTLADRKAIGLDLAYVKWNFAQKAALVAGKQPLPFWRPVGSEMVWDSDWTPEGISLLAPLTQGGSWEIKPVVAYLWIKQRRPTEPDSNLITGRLEATGDLGNDNKLMAALGYLTYTQTQGHSALFGTGGSGFAGNTSSGPNYASSFGIIQASAEFDTPLGGKALKVGGDLAINGSASANGTGFALGGSWGGSAKAGDWGVRYQYRHVEADATLGSVADSDFSGGGTNVAGHVFGAELGLAQNVKMNATYFAGSVGVNAAANYSRAQLDLSLKF
ncbi:MAG TPA: putative porin [Bdellovibrionota bacterium]|nr:putative porin [Bdellovibrionota bacterium]